MKRRAAFTLIELLVVMAIIGILVTITLSAAGGLITHARDSATRATISKIQSLLNSRGQAFHRLTMRSGYLVGTAEYQQVKFQYPALPLGLQQTLAIKQLQRRYFPQVQLEAIMAAPQLPVQPLIASNPDAINAEILCDFLTQSNVLGDSPLGTDAFSASELSSRTSAAGATLTRFIDAWGTPIRFYRWPTRLFRSGGQTGANSIATISSADTNNVRLLFSTLPVFTGNLGPDTAGLFNTDLDRDPDDPLKDCLFGFANFENSYHTPATYHVFLVVSAGPDLQFGMYAPEDASNFGHLGAVQSQQALTDDIISLNIRAGGK